MTTLGSEQEAFALVIDRHKSGVAEENIATAFQFFLEKAGIAPLSDMTAQTRPGPEGSGRMDLYVYNTCIEFKKDILNYGVIRQADIDQLDGYIEQLVKAGSGVRNGILTDGVNYLIRHVGTDKLPVEQGENHTVFELPDQASSLREYLYRVISAPAENISPTSDNLTRFFGAKSDVFRAANTMLLDAHKEHRDSPTVAVKRKLWQELLQVALGQNSAADNEEKDWLFVRHTYLTTLVSIVVQAHFGIDVMGCAEKQPGNLLNGRELAQNTNLKGIIESDLFSWPLEVGLTQYVRIIAEQVSRFNWTERVDELAATLYQNTVTQEERKAMGEYYTPKWLAEVIVTELVPDPENTRMLDPSCGSGTFIEAAIHHLLNKTGEMDGRTRLALLQNNIAGIDLHPVAVQLAKATWVINCQEAITEARREHPDLPDITAPIHLGDSMQLRYDNSTLIGQGYITLRTGERLENDDEVTFQIPLTLAADTQRFDELMIDVAEAIEQGYSTDGILEREGITEESERRPLAQTISRMKDLHSVNRNHIWAYYLRNMTRPVAIAQQKVDAIIGNPPWLKYSDSANIVREELREMSEKRYQIWAGGKLAPQQDLATLFYCRVAELYLEQGGLIGMVMPHSTLRSGHHIKFRTGQYIEQVKKREKRTPRSMSLDFSVKPPWDLDYLDTDALLPSFPMPASVVFSRLITPYASQSSEETKNKALAPGNVEMWRSTAETQEVERAIEALHHDDGEFHSPYADYSMQGPTIVDRRLFFVTTSENKTITAAPGTYKTHPRTGNQDKKSYSVAALEDKPIHEDNLFDVYLGESLVPFVTLTPLTAALPVSKANMTMPLDHSKCEQDEKSQRCKKQLCEVDAQKLDSRMMNRWAIMEQLWEGNRGDKDEKSLTQNLNWLSKLTSQLEYLVDPGYRPVRIAYTNSGRPTAALIEDEKAILDTRLYQVTCRSSKEAYYLLAIINSTAMAKAVKPFCTTNWAKEIRDLHKHLWKLPVSEFDSKNKLHTKLAKLGQDAEKEAKARIMEMTNDLQGSPTVDAGRDELRNNWQRPMNPPKKKKKGPERFSKTAADIEEAVSELLGTN